MLSSSSFFLSRYLALEPVSGKLTAEQISFIQTNNIVSTYPYLLKKSETGSAQWLIYLSALAKIDGVYAEQLAQFYLQSANENKAALWLKQAIRLGNTNAQYQLAQHYWQQKSITPALTLLDELLSLDSLNDATLLKAIKLRITLAVFLGEQALFTPLVAQLLRLESHSDFYRQLIYFGVIASNEDNMLLAKGLLPKSAKSAKSPVSCRNKVALYASNLAHLNRLQYLLTAINPHAIADNFCFAVPKYIPADILNCHSTAKKPIRCDETIWADVINESDTRYVVTLTEEGGANVHYGILYLDQYDTPLVFVHELAHLLGFIDEYPLADQHPFCHEKSTSFANNLFKHPAEITSSQSKAQLRTRLLTTIPWADQISASTELLTLSGNAVNKTINTWLVGTPSHQKNRVGLFPAKTCDNAKHKQSVFKPVASQTILERFEAPYPQPYQLLQKQLNDKFAMPSYHYNVALAFYHENNETKAREFLLKSAMQETSELRKNNIVIGNFN